jgi:phosphatidylglycerophosphate synthase
MREAPVGDGLAFKAREIEEFVDVYFFRRVGIVFARAARALGISPTGVTMAALVVGAAGGALLASARYAWLGVALLVFHGVLDSSDGQLARMTGRSSEFGRVMDGVAGYVTHIAMYIGILVSALSRGTGWWLVAAAAAAGLSTVVHAQMYDYHRTAYAAFVVRGEVPASVAGVARGGVVGWYEAMQRLIAGFHPVVERLIAGRQVDGHVRSGDRARYRQCFYGPVRGWNLMGDNVRRLSVVVATWFGRPEWFIYAELLPLNVLFAGLWWLQRRADERFLSGE